MTDGTTSTFSVFNGAKGEKGDKGEDSGEGIYLPLTGGTSNAISGDIYFRHTDYVKGTIYTEDKVKSVTFLESGTATGTANRTARVLQGITKDNGTNYFNVYVYSPIAGADAYKKMYFYAYPDGTYKAGVDAPFYGAVWNDYAEFRETDSVEAGRVVYEKGDDTLAITTERMTPACSIVSDTFGFAIGETEKCKTPLAQAGRVLAYPLEDRNSYKPGDAVCSGPNGTVSKMTQEEKINYPECIIGYVSCIPSYEIWGENNTKVNNRIWIKVI